MGLPAITAAATRIPWTKILPYLPFVVKAARDMRERWNAKPKPAPIDPAAPVPTQISVIAQRVQALEAGEREQSEITSRIAEQLEGLAEEVREVAARQKRMLRLCIGAFALASCALFVSIIAHTA